MELPLPREHSRPSKLCSPAWQGEKKCNEFGGKPTGIRVDNLRRGKSVGSIFAPQSCAPYAKLVGRERIAGGKSESRFLGPRPAHVTAPRPLPFAQRHVRGEAM